ncbi:MAG: large subunit ribosomal protein L13 [Flavobacteriaceae bacterium]|jgi:large subunit ribosomal protein L13
MKESHRIDAEGKSLGRVASDAAFVLLGKDMPDYSANSVVSRHVVIDNADKLNITGKKEKEKTYSRFSGYPGGLKKIPMEKIIDKKGYEEVVKKAVYGMLPSNKLRARRMKFLQVNVSK